MGSAAFDTARNCDASSPAKFKYAEDEEARKTAWLGMPAQIRENFLGSTVEKITTWSLPVSHRRSFEVREQIVGNVAEVSEKKVLTVSPPLRFRLFQTLRPAR